MPTAIPAGTVPAGAISTGTVPASAIPAGAIPTGADGEHCQYIVDGVRLPWPYE